MDQLTLRPDPQSEHDLPMHKSGFRRVVSALFLVCVLGAVLIAGVHLGRTQLQLPGWLPSPVAALIGGHAKPFASGSVVYYRDPDGKPAYSAQPKKTPDGRDYVAVQASEDVSFDDKPDDTVAGAGKRLLYYRNPMGLPDTSPVPKKDSMGMEYIPVYAGDDDGSTVKVSPGRLQRTGVRSEIAKRRIVSRPVRVPGTIQLDERRITIVSMRFDAFIDTVENVTTGDRVRKGQSLFSTSTPPDIAAAGGQLMANPGYEGARRRLENFNVPPELIAEIERTHKVPKSIDWSSPQDGLVLERNAVPGMKAQAGQVLFRIADHSVVWALADVPERDLGLVAEGQPATVRVRGYPGRPFTGTVSRIYPHINSETRTARLRIELANSDGLLRPEMYADIELATGGGAPVVAVPESAVIDSGTRQVVILDKGDGRFEPRPVKVGVRGEGYTEITEGISEGDRIVVSANFLIDAESNLKAALRAFTDGEQPK